MRKLFALLLCFLIFSRPASADSWGIWSDGFDSDLLKWEEVQNEQHARHDEPCRGPDADRYDWTVENGEASLQIDLSMPCSIAIVPRTDEVSSLLAYSVSFQMRIHHPAQDRNWLLRWKDAENVLRFHIFGEAIYPEKIVNGQSYSLGTPGSFPFKGGETYTIRLEYDSSLYRVRLFIDDNFVRDFSESRDDPQLLEGKPGLAGSVGAGVSYSRSWYDDFEVAQIDSKLDLPVESLKQNDPRWKAVEYDHASTWSPTLDTMERWGCSLVSAVMVLRYHGIVSLPSGIPLYPDTVNEWLLQQSDGYLGEGHVNWRALTRLSWLAHESQGSTKLEVYRVQPNENDKISWLREQLAQNMPTILEEPGHFIVATGFGPGEKRIRIHDPFFRYTELFSYQDRYVSARLFVPSNTDMSALTFWTSPEHSVRFYGSSGKEVEPDATWIEPPLRDAVSGETQGRAYQVYEFLKPDDLALSVVAESSGQKAETVTVLAYQENGEVTRKDWVIEGSSAVSTLEVEYFKQTPTQFVELSPSDKRFSPEMLASWLTSSELRSPLLLEEILRWQEQLVESGTLAQAEAQMRRARVLLSAALRNDWIEPWVVEQILRIFQAIIRSRFP